LLECIVTVYQRIIYFVTKNANKIFFYKFLLYAKFGRYLDTERQSVKI
jgi:hypothetical protein